MDMVKDKGMVTVTDEIGDKYEEWGKLICERYEEGNNTVMGKYRNDNCVFISSPTGSGKTYFILHVLLPYVSSKGRKLLYLVNRKILKEQIENEFMNIPYEQRCEVKNSIKIETYQAIESEISNIKHNESEKKDADYIIPQYVNYHYVVCDECHYFLADSNFNTNTILSFRFVQEQFAEKIRIFMSATINDIRSVIIKDNVKREKWDVVYECSDEYKYTVETEKYGSTYHYGVLYDAQETIMYNKAVSDIMELQKLQFEYNLKKDYSYIHINILEGRERIADIIKNTEDSGKWFIFVDSIKFGNNLKVKLEQETRYTVVMIKAEYKDDGEAIEVVDEIVEKGTIEKADIVISTSVMDNGINLKDKKLNHFVLLADTEVEFIQMLGRKRKDNRPLELYIIGQDKEHFKMRKRWVEKRLRIAEEYLDCLEGLKEHGGRSPFESAESYCRQKYIRLEREKRKEIDDLFEKYLMNKKDAIETLLKNKRDKKNEQEQKLIEEQHIKIMSRIFNSSIYYGYAKNIYNVYKGKLYLNLLSFQNLENLNQYYTRIIGEFDSVGEDAFLKEQLGWLGIRGREADDMIKEAREREETKAREVIIDRITKLIEFSEQNEQEKQDDQDEQFKQPFDKQTAINFLKTIKNELVILLKNVPDDDYKDKCIKAVERGDRPISKPMMEYFREKCKLPFKVEVDRKKGLWTFVKYEGDKN